MIIEVKMKGGACWAVLVEVCSPRTLKMPHVSLIALVGLFLAASTHSYTTAFNPDVFTRCDPGCAGHGTCDEITGACVCPPWMKGPSCTQPALPSCMDGILPAGYLGCAGFLTTCACLEECDSEGLTYEYDQRAACVKVHETSLLAVLTREGVYARPLTDLGLLVTYHRGGPGNPGKILGPLQGHDRSAYPPQASCEHACSGRGICTAGKDGKPSCSCFQPELGASRLGPGCSGARPDVLLDCMHFVYTLHEDIRGMEQNFHKILLTSQHRTADPEEADFFFVPTWSRRVPLQWQSGMAFHREIFAHIKSAYPYWDRNSGADHIFVSTSDYGACGTHKEHAKSRLLPAPDLASAIWLHHYGLKVLDEDGDHSLGLGPCHIPGHDIVIPSNSFVYDSSDYMQESRTEFLITSPMVKRGGVVNTVFWENSANQRRFLGESESKELKPNKLLFFAGASGISGPHSKAKEYSHGVRQRVFELFENRTDIGVVLSRKKVGRGYGRMLATSRFCLAPTGSGFGIRVIDAVVVGCIPVIISDNVDQPLEELLPYELFSVRVEERHIPDLLDILLAITPEEEQEMHRQLECCMTRFLWRSVIRDRPLPPGPDAFASIMEVLRRRMEGKGDVRLKSCCALE
eukprot:jgi/Mesvir1/7205/Mv19028-RA.3